MKRSTAVKKTLPAASVSKKLDLYEDEIEDRRETMTFKELRKAIPETIGVARLDGEYRINFHHGHEPTAYYTSDIQDALNTARLMDEQCRGGKNVVRPKPAAPKYPEAVADLTGHDGNAFMIMGTVSNALRSAHVSQDEIYAFVDEARRGDYDHLLQTAMSWVSVQ